MAAGDKATLWYCSANRDEDKFADPWTFDVARTPNPHAGFGGGGAHFCLGANLARREISVAFEELHRQIPDIQATEEPAVGLIVPLGGVALNNDVARNAQVMHKTLILMLLSPRKVILSNRQ